MAAAPARIDTGKGPAMYWMRISTLWCVLAGVAVSGTFAQRIAVADTMYWTDKDRSQVWRADRDGSNAELLLDATDGVSDPRGLSLDRAGGKMYWAENGSNRIRRANLDGSAVETIVNTDLGFPADLELDPAAGKIYWADRDRDWIRRADLDGANSETVISVPAAGNDAAPYYLALDLAGSQVYWTDFDSRTIHRANLDGTQQEAFLTVASPARLRDLALDLEAQMIYWADRGSSPKIQRASLDGSGIATLFDAADGLDRPHGLAIDSLAGTIYWTDTDTGDVVRGDIGGIGSPQILRNGSAGTNGPWAIAVAEPSGGILAMLAGLTMAAYAGRRRWAHRSAP